MVSKISSTKQGRYVVAKQGEVSPGERKIISINGREIGIFNVAGKFYAMRNHCPHKGAPLCLGRIGPLITSPGVTQIEQSQTDKIIRCPWHLWNFSLETGQSIHNPRQRVRTYTVRVEDDEIVLYLSENKSS
ncbi:MAG: Rieske (2Fe-2S) protein [Chloroflexota bacterium]